MNNGLSAPGRAGVRSPIAPMYAEPPVGSVQVSQRLAGHEGEPLRREAWQQSSPGRDAGVLRDLRAADLAFFSDREDRHITHVAIALGGKRLVHLALGRGGFAVERLDDVRDAYVAKLTERFLFARRVL